VDTTQVEVDGVVTRQQIETLPLKSRNYLSLALLVPRSCDRPPTGSQADRSIAIRRFVPMSLRPRLTALLMLCKLRATSVSTLAKNGSCHGTIARVGVTFVW